MRHRGAGQTRAVRRWLPAAAVLCGAAAIWPPALSAPINAFILNGRSVLLAGAAAGAAGGVTNNVSVSSATVSTMLTKMAKTGELAKAERGYKLPQ